MTNNINRIGINTGSVNQYVGQPQKDNNPKANEGTPTPTSAAPSQPQISPDAVLTYMAGTAQINLPKTYDVNKYVNPESAARIAAMMGDFEAGVVAGLAKFEEEIGAMFQGLSEQDQMALAAEYFASETL